MSEKRGGKPDAGDFDEGSDVKEQIRELERGGLRELMFATGVDDKWRFSEEFARRVMARY